MRYASAKSLEMKAAFNNNLPHQTGDVIVNPINPENPDSNTTRCCAHNFLRRFSNMGVFLGYFLKIILNQDLQDFEDYRGRLRSKSKVFS